MSSPNSESFNTRPTDRRPALQKLLFVSDAAVADVDELPSAVRAIIRAATEIFVLTPLSRGDSHGSPTTSINSGISPTSASTPC